VKIAIGFATILGTIGAAAGVIIPFIGELSDTAAPLGISPDLWLKAGAALAGLVIIGRMAQAVAAVFKSPSQDA
jgi:hypothetical protein